MWIRTVLTLVFSWLLFSLSYAETPAVAWSLSKGDLDAMDYYFNIQVDTDDTKSVFYAQYVHFQDSGSRNIGGYLGLQQQRKHGRKTVLFSLWSSLDSIDGTIPGAAIKFTEDGGGSGLKTDSYQWRVGHTYRFRVERDPLPKDDGAWWRLSIYDMTENTVEILGSIKVTDDMSGIASRVDSFIERYRGPYHCEAQPYVQAIYGAPEGNYGQVKAKSVHPGSYGELTPCDSMVQVDGGNTLDEELKAQFVELKDKSVIVKDNLFKGVIPWGNYDRFSLKNWVSGDITEDMNSNIFQKKHTNTHWYFPLESSNSWWNALGPAKPVINERRKIRTARGNLDAAGNIYLLTMDGKEGYYRSVYNKPSFHSNAKKWAEKPNNKGIAGDIYIDHNITDGIQYFKLKSVGYYWYFPEKGTSSDKWEYIGTWRKYDSDFVEAGNHLEYIGIASNEIDKVLKTKQWADPPENTGMAGDIYSHENLGKTYYYRLKSDGAYWYYPDGKANNKYWDYLGEHL
jgi:hypothetical protein